MKIKYKELNIEETYYSEDLRSRYGLSLEKFIHIVKNNSDYVEVDNSDIPNLIDDWTFYDLIDKDLTSLKNIPNICFQVGQIEKGNAISYSLIMREENGSLTLLDGGHRLLSSYKLGLDVEVLVIPELLPTDIFSQKDIDEWFNKKYPNFEK